MEGFAHFGDARALGPTFYLLFQAALQTTRGYSRQATRYALAGAAVHPYSFVLEGLDYLKKQHEFEEQDFKAMVEQLWAGRTDVFRSAIYAMSRLVPENTSIGMNLMAANLKRTSRLLGFGADMEEWMAANLI
jgi:hypothetical protein